MPQFDTPEQYLGSPDDVVLARRVDGTGHVRLEPNELQPGMPACECHPMTGGPEDSCGVIHPGDVIRMRRGECVGFFRSFSERPGNPDWPLTHVWNSGRADFEYVSEEDGTDLYATDRPAAKPAKSPAKSAPKRAAKAGASAPIPENVPDIDPNAVSVDPNAPADIPAADQAQQ